MYRDMAAATRRVNRDPAAAVRAISNGHPDAVLFQAVVNSSLDVSRIWTAGGATLYIRYIREGYQTNAEPHPDPSITSEPTWTKPLKGLLNILAGIRKAKAPQRDSSTLKEISEAYNSIIGVVWRDLNFLLPPGPQADFRRRIVVHFIKNVILAADSKRYARKPFSTEFFSLIGFRDLYDDNTIGLVMHCWLNMSVDREHREHAVDVIHLLFSEIEAPAPDVIMDKAVRVVTVDMINMRIRSILGDAKMLDAGLEDEMESLRFFVRSERPWSIAFANARLYEPIVHALERQLKNGSPQTMQSVLSVGINLIQYVAAPIQEDYTLMIKQAQ